MLSLSVPFAHAEDAAPAAAPAAIAPMAAAQGVTLRLKYSLGQSLYYRLVTDMDGTILTGQSGAGMPIKQHMEMLMRQTVKDVRATDGAATIDTGIDSMTMTMNGQSMPMPADKMAQMKTVGTFVILPTGKSLSFKPSAALANAALPGMDLTKMNSMSSLGQLPDGPVKPGDSWKSAISMGMLGSSMAAHFVLDSVDTTGGKNIAVVNQTTDGLFDTSTSKSGGPMGLKMTGHITGSGVLRFDVDGGAIDSQTSKADITMNMTPPGAAMPMKMQMKMSSTLTRASAPPPVIDPKVQ